MCRGTCNTLQNGKGNSRQGRLCSGTQLVGAGIVIGRAGGRRIWTRSHPCQPGADGTTAGQPRRSLQAQSGGCHCFCRTSRLGPTWSRCSTIWAAPWRINRSNSMRKPTGWHYMWLCPLNSRSRLPPKLTAVRRTSGCTAARCLCQPPRQPHG